MSGIGFGTSDVVILELLAELKKLPADATITRKVDLYLIDADESLFGNVLDLAARLRQAGFTAEFSYRRQTLGKQLKQAVACNAPRVVIVGSEYSQRGVVSVKNLATGRQVEVPVDRFLADPMGWPPSEGV